jgi:hypothetical protein
MHQGALPAPTKAGEGSGGWWPTSPSSRWVGRPTTPASWPPTTSSICPPRAVHGAQVPWGKVVTQGVPVVSARRLPSMLGTLPAVLGPERVVGLADQARIRFHPAA